MPALAAGGTHIVDDSAVETPGVCNTELFGTRFGPGSSSATLNVNCTFDALPRLELGLGVIRAREDGSAEAEFGPAFKWNLAEPDGGSPGLALTGLVKIGTRSGRLESVNIFVPVTFALSTSTLFSLNAGWQHVRQADARDTAKFGGQLEVIATPTLGLMGEVFATLESSPGAQAGIRWTPADMVDLDLTLGHRVDGLSDVSVAAGLVLRF